MPSTIPVPRFLSNWQDEVDSAAQYHAMAMSEPDEAVARVYRELAAVEEKHTTFWEHQLRKAGIEVGPRKPSWRSRVLSWIARRYAGVPPKKYRGLDRPDSHGDRLNSRKMSLR